MSNFKIFLVTTAEEANRTRETCTGWVFSCLKFLVSSSHLVTPPGQVKTTTGENTSSSIQAAIQAGATNSAATKTNSKNSLHKRQKREKLLQTESNDFKLVFISSGDSSKDSDQLNSSLENGAADTSLPNGEFIGDMEYEDELNQQHNHPPALPPKTRQVLFQNKNNNNNLNEFGPLDRMSINSTSGTSIRTAATRDRHSPLLR